MHKLLPVLLCSCALPVYATPDPVIEQAAGDLGLRVKYVERKRGAVVVKFQPTLPGHGVMLPCGGEAESIHQRDVLRQELGHALGLVHVDDPSNVMHGTSVGSDTIELTRQQRRTLRAAVAWLHICGRR